MLRLINDLIEEHRSNIPLRGRLLLLDKIFDKLRTQNNALQQKLSSLENHTPMLAPKEAVVTNLVIPSFVRHSGVKFKRKLSGGFERTAFCPSCNYPLSSLNRLFPLRCKKCHFDADFCHDDLRGILTTVDKEFGK